MLDWLGCAPQAGGILVSCAGRSQWVTVAESIIIEIEPSALLSSNYLFTLKTFQT